MVEMVNKQELNSSIIREFDGVQDITQNWGPLLCFRIMLKPLNIKTGF